jgi:hypothetical protein
MLGFFLSCKNRIIVPQGGGPKALAFGGIRGTRLVIGH